ncbi:hypothetical protein D3C78_1695010 [compost metagenome]
MQQRQRLDQQIFPIDTARSGLRDLRHHLFAIGTDQRFENSQRLFIVKRAQHLADGGGGHLPLSHGNRLVSEAQCITHTAIGGTRQ